MWNRDLEGVKVELSQQVLEWQALAREHGRQEGLREAAKRAMEGKIVEARALLMRILDARFGYPVPADVAHEIAVQYQLTVLDRWFRPAVTVPSLDAFRETVHIAATGKDPHRPIS